ncbi:hypothetical protein ACFBZI_08405 [Moraxella sp. ZJ142]|uniref:hypothetical protein n=1 Tax=Moraxella marmotae TaxID=3344520 RepID=UPI0035D4425E
MHNELIAQLIKCNKSQARLIDEVIYHAAHNAQISVDEMFELIDANEHLDNIERQNAKLNNLLSTTIGKKQ